MKFTNKVCIVTGAGSGLGKVTALLMAKEGASVVIAEKNVESGEKSAQEMETSGGESLFLEVDVSQSRDTRKMAQKTIERFGKIDILVANAGILEPVTPTHEVTEKSWDRLTGVHLKGTFLCCKAVLPYMIAQKSGRIVTCSSVSVKLRAPGSIHYVASKAGIEAMTRSMAVEYGPYGIYINGVAPGFVSTPMWDAFGGLDGEFAQRVLPLIPLGRSAQADEVARVVAFLASEDASYITGQIVDINGGLT